MEPNLEHLRMMKQKISEALDILDFLNKTFGLQYNLQLMQFDPNFIKVKFEEHFYNSDIKPVAAIYFEQQMTLLKQQIELLPSLLAQGKILAVCEDDSGKPENIGDWIVRNGVYRVLGMRLSEVPGIYSYVLEGLNPNEPYKGYRTTRFKLLRPEETKN